LTEQSPDVSLWSLCGTTEWNGFHCTSRPESTKVENLKLFQRIFH